jgi:hypothetical protein
MYPPEAPQPSQLEEPLSLVLWPVQGGGSFTQQEQGCPVANLDSDTDEMHMAVGL